MTLHFDQNPFSESAHFEEKKIHMAVTGSVAAYKAVELLRAFHKIGITTTVTLTASAKQFVSPLLFRSLGASHVYDDMFAEGADPFAHLEPGMSADAMLVVPATANALAELAAGLANDMFSTQTLAFTGPLVIAPAMNPRMWINAATRYNVKVLHERGYDIVDPGFGDTACGENGQGRLAELPEIFLHTLKALSPGDMKGLKVMVTLGPTRERWDGVRFWTNASSGKMGCSLATCAWLRGARVIAICGPGINIHLPSGIKRIDVTSAEEMFMEAKRAWHDVDFGIFSAAVSDFAPIRPKEKDDIKFKKSDNSPELNIVFRHNQDILKTLAAQKRPGQKILGFAAEITPDMQSLFPLAKIKLEGKNADLLAANRVNPNSGAFGSSLDSVAVVDKNGAEEIWSAINKADIAWDLCSWLLRI